MRISFRAFCFIVCVRCGMEPFEIFAKNVTKKEGP